MALAKDPGVMAGAFAAAVQAGRDAFLAGSMTEQDAAQASFVSQMVSAKMGSAELAAKAYKLAEGDPVNATLMLAQSQVKRVKTATPPPTPSQSREDLMSVDTSKMSEEEFARWRDAVASL